MRAFGFVIEKCEPKYWFQTILPSKNIGNIGCVQYFVYISGVVRPFWLGMVSIVRGLFRLQIHSKQSIHMLYGKTLQAKYLQKRKKVVVQNSRILPCDIFPYSIWIDCFEWICSLKRPLTIETIPSQNGRTTPEI